MKALPFTGVRWVVPGLLLLLCMPAVAQGQPVLSAADPVLTEVTGDGDAFVENFETWAVTVQLTNTGSAPATAISATLTSSTPGVTIGSGNSAYPDLNPAASASNITPFQFSLSALPPCGGRLSFTLTVAFSGGSSLETFNFTIQTGAPGAPVTFSYIGPVVPIADAFDLTGDNPGAPAIASLLVAAVIGNVRDVNLRIDGSSCSSAIGATTVGIDHTFASDLHVTLRSPSATSVLVMHEPDGSGNNFCQTVLDDESAGPPIQTRPSANAPFTGSFTPNAPLSLFDGENPNGTWQLRVQDFFSGDIGNIRAWSVIITPAICDAPAADLAITATDGVTTATPGGSVTYTITASNTGPNGVTGATVADTFPAALSCTWTCVGAGSGTCTAAGSGNINDTVDLPAGGSVTYTASCTISPSATGSLVNTATVTSGAFDPDLANNSATDIDALTLSADLAITKTDGITATPGGSVTYTIVASNAGPSSVTGAAVTDTFPAALTCTWTCVGAGSGTCTAAGSGNINDTVNLPAGGSVTYTVACTISPSATGSLVNTATVTSTVTDPTSANNSATDTDTLTPSANLAITKTDGVTTATAGGSVTYTIVASNAGPSSVTGATVADTFPGVLTCTWTCVGAGSGTCTAAGSGNINDTVNLPVGGSVTYSAACTISPSATGSLTNTATVTAPAGVIDPSPANNSATDTDTLVPLAGAAVTGTKTVTGTFAVEATVTYTVTLTNTGPGAQGDNPGNEFTDVLPASLALVSATATSGTALANVGTNAVTWNGSIPAGGSVTITITATILAGAAGTTVENQGAIAFDGDGNGTNESTAATDDPGTPGSGDPTGFAVGAAAIPTLSPLAMLGLALILAALALVSLKARRLA